MKLYLSADMEGTCGITCWDETEYGHPRYGHFAQQMTREVASACEAATECDYDVLVKDAHDSAMNLEASVLPPRVKLLRGWTGDIFCMMGGIDRFKFDAAAFTGYHSEATSDGNSLSHTMTRRAHFVKINGQYASEFLINSYTAAMFGIPIVFLSGDAALCETARRMIPGITCVASKTGIGAACLSEHPSVVCERISAGMKKALSGDYKKSCMLSLPEAFTVEVCYREITEAYRKSFYKDAVMRENGRIVSYTTDSYLEVLRFMHFCL